MFITFNMLKEIIKQTANKNTGEYESRNEKITNINVRTKKVDMQNEKNHLKASPAKLLKIESVSSKTK